MNKLIKISFVFYILTILSKSAYPLTSSSYLMSNAAIQSYDYEKAALFFDEEKKVNNFS